MSTNGIQLNNRRRVVSQHTNVGSRLLDDIAVGHKLVRIFCVFVFVSTVTLKVEEKVTAAGLCDRNSAEERMWTA